MSDVKVQAVVEASTDGVERAFDRVGDKAVQMASKVDQAAQKAGGSVDKIGSGAGTSADQLTRAEGRMVASIKRVQTQMELAGKTASQKFEFNIAAKGLDAAKFEPYLQQLRKMEAAALSTSAVSTSAFSSMGSAVTAFGVAAGAAVLGAVYAFDSLVKKAGDFQDMAEKVGGSAEGLASMAVAAATAGAQMDTVAGAMNRMTKGLVGVDDTSKSAGAAISALGLQLSTFKELAPEDQMEAVAKALSGFEDGARKSAVAMALFGKSGAELMPFLKELGAEGGRQQILTQAQITLADEYADKQAKLTAEIGLYAQSIAIQALPAMNDLFGAFADTLKGVAGVNDEVTGLAENNGVAEFAGGAVKALAFVMDSVDGVSRAFQIVGKSIAGATAIAVNPYTQSGAIWDAMAEDIEGVVQRTTVLGALQERTAKRAVASISTVREELKKLNFEGVVKPISKVNNKSEYNELFLQQEQEAANLKALNKELSDIADLRNDYAKAVASMLDPLEKEARTLELQAENYGLTRAEIEATTIARLEEAKAIATANGASEEAITFYEREIDARKRIKAASEGVDAKKASEEWLKESKNAAKKTADEWEKTSEKIGDSITDALMRGFESGKDFAETLRDTVVNMFKTMVLQPTIKAVVVGGLSAVGMGGAMAADGTSAGGMGGIGNMLSTGNSIFQTGSMLAGGYGALPLTETIANGVGMMGGDSLGSLIGMNAHWTAGAGAAAAADLGATIGTAAGTALAGSAAGTVFATTATGAAVSTTTAAGVAAASGAGAAGAGTAAMAAVPVVGWIAAAAVAAYAIFGHKKTQDTGAVATSTNGGMGANVLIGRGTSADTYDAGIATGVASINKSYFDTLNPLLAALGNKQVFSITSDMSAKKKGNGNQFAGFDIGVDGKNSTLQYGYGKISDADALAKATSSALGEGISRAISLSDLSAPIKKLFDGLVDQAIVGTMVTGLTKVANSSKELNDVWGISVSQAAEVALLTGQTQEGVAKTVDAIGTFAAAQRTVGATLESAYASLDPVFTQLTNSVLPDNLAAYDAAMKSVDTTVTGGIETFAALFAMREGFAQFRAVIDGLKTSASTAIDAFRTPEERLTLKQSALSDLSTKAGIAVPTSGAALVAMFDSIDFTKPTQAGMNLAAVLPAIAAAFTEVQNAEKALASGATAAATAMEELRTTLLEHFATAQTLDQSYAAVSTGLGMSVDSLKNMSAEDLNKNLTGLITGADAAKLAIINGLIPALDLIGENATAVAAAAKEAAEAVAAVTQGLRDNAASLNVELLAAQGNTSGSLAAARDIAIAGMNAEQAALWDTNTATQALIASLNTQAEKTAAVASERKGLQDQLDDLTMTSTQLLLKQRDALDESNRALFDSVEAAKRAAAIASERKGLQDQLDDLTMSSSQLLNKQRDALDESNRALFDNIEAVKQAKAIADERKVLQDQLDDLTMTSAQLLNQQRDALDESNRGLFDQVEAIKAANAAMADLANQIESIGSLRANVQGSKQGVISQMSNFDAVGYYGKQVQSYSGLFAGATTTNDKLDYGSKWQSAIASGLEAQIAALGKTKDTRLKALQEEADAINDNAAKQKQNAQEMASALENIAEYAKNMLTGNLSTLSPEAKLAAAKSEYTRLYSAAQSGDATAAGQLTGASDTYLGLAKDYYASTAGYTDIFGSVQAQLSGLGSQASVYEQIANSTASSYDLAKVTAEVDAAYQAQVLLLQQAAVDQYAALDGALGAYQGTLEFKLDNTVIELQTLGVKSDTIADNIDASQKAITSSLERVRIAQERQNALLERVSAQLTEANIIASKTAGAVSATASTSTLAGAL